MWPRRRRASFAGLHAVHWTIVSFNFFYWSANRFLLDGHMKISHLSMPAKDMRVCENFNHIALKPYEYIHRYRMCASQVTLLAGKLT